MDPFFLGRQESHFAQELSRNEIEGWNKKGFAGLVEHLLAYSSDNTQT